MFRRGFLKAALGASAAVALGEMGIGTQEAEAQAYCSYVDSKCADGCGAPGCSFTCKRAPYSGCSVCQACRQDAECAQAAFVCADGCSAGCAYRCARGSAGCPACEVCDPE